MNATCSGSSAGAKPSGYCCTMTAMSAGYRCNSAISCSTVMGIVYATCLRYSTGVSIGVSLPKMSTMTFTMPFPTTLST